jgi:acyl dehydratase
LLDSPAELLDHLAIMKNKNAVVQNYASLVGRQVGISSWKLIDQAMVNAFADVTGDHQFIHVDPVRAAQTPFGGTIAHGYLVLSLIIGMAQEVMPAADGAMGVNFGFNKVRFIAPVRTGSRVRGAFAMKDFIERSPGQFQSIIDVTVEIEGQEKPAMVAEWLGLIIV